MSITNITIKQTDPISFLVEWTSSESDVLFYIFRDGELVGQTYDTSYHLSAEPSESMVIDVFDSVDYGLATTNLTRRAVLVWQASSDAVQYVIEQYVGSAWVELGTINSGTQGYYSYETKKLSDVTTAQFRVIPYGEFGDAGDALEYSFLVVGTPDAPNPTVAYNDDDGKLTITI